VNQHEVKQQLAATMQLRKETQEMSEEKPVRYHVRRREFLNEDPEMPGFIIGIVEDTSEIPDENEQGWKWGNIVLDFADCSRRVSFSFDLSETEARVNSLRKINLIAEVVNSVRDAIAKEVDSRNARPQVQDQSQGAVA
jgi:hypothetical protein